MILLNDSVEEFSSCHPFHKYVKLRRSIYNLKGLNHIGMINQTDYLSFYTQRINLIWIQSVLINNLHSSRLARPTLNATTHSTKTAVSQHVAESILLEDKNLAPRNVANHFVLFRLPDRYCPFIISVVTIWEGSTENEFKKRTT
jgi:hypothetical protein